MGAVFVAAMFMNILDSTITTVALPTLSRSFGVPLASVSGVVTAYLVTLAVAMPASAWLGDRFGARRVIIAAIGLFTVASALCGLAVSLPELVAFRAVQGIGGGLLVPVGTAMLFRAFPPAERIRANRILMVPMLLAPALGPVIGGALVTGLSWRWIFYVNVPVGVAALAFGSALPRGSHHPAGRFDLPGFGLAAAGFPLFMFALSTGALSGWGSPSVLGTGAPGTVLLACFIAVELRAAEPMLRLRIFSDRLFRTTNMQLAIAGAGFNGTLFLVPLLLQNGLGFSALHSGLSTFPEAIGGMTGIQITTRLYKRTGPRRLMLAGMTGTVCSIGGMAVFAGPQTAMWLVPALMFVTGGSFGFSMIPSQTANMATVSAAETGHGSTLMNTMRQAGGAAGVALLGTVVAVTHPGPLNLLGFRDALFVAAALMAAGAVVSALVRDADAAPTLARGRAEPPASPLAEAA